MCQVEDDAADEPPADEPPGDEAPEEADSEWQEAVQNADNEVDAALVEADAPENLASTSDKPFAPRWTQDARGVIWSGPQRLGILLIKIIKSGVCM